VNHGVRNLFCQVELREPIVPSFKRKSQHGFEEKTSIKNLLTAPFRAVFGFLFEMLGGPDSGRIGSQMPLKTRLWYTAKGILFLPFYLIFQVMKFIVLSWTTTRNGNQAIWSIVPLAGVFAVIGIVIVADIFEKRRILGLHQAHTAGSLEADDVDSALLFSKRLVNISATDAIKFSHATVADTAGMPENAVRLASEVADLEVGGFVPAHVFQARKLLETPVDDPAYQERLQDASDHLMKAVLNSPDGRNYNYQLALTLLPKIAFQMGEKGSAYRQFKNIAEIAPEVVPDLVKHLIDSGEEEEAGVYTRKGLRALRRMQARNPNIRGVWTNTAQIHMANKEYDKAFEFLENGLKEASHELTLFHIATLMSQVRVEQARTIGDVSNRDDFRSKLKWVCDAIKFGPRNQQALKEFVELFIYPPEGVDPGWIEDEVLDSANQNAFHIIQGVRDSIKGKPGTGCNHFSLAFDGNRLAPLAINEIATYILDREYRPEDALKVIDVAIETWPGTAKLFQTRGQILTNLGRLDEALAELEYAVEMKPNDPGALFAIAACYEKMGRTDEAVTLREKGQVLWNAIAAKQKENYEALLNSNR